MRPQRPCADCGKVFLIPPYASAVELCMGCINIVCVSCGTGLALNLSPKHLAYYAKRHRKRTKK